MTPDYQISQQWPPFSTLDGVRVQFLHCLESVVLQLVHQVQLDNLLLDGDTLAVDDVGKQPQGLLAEVVVVGAQEGHQDGHGVGVPDQDEDESLGPGAGAEIGKEAGHRRHDFDQGAGVRLLVDLVRADLEFDSNIKKLRWYFEIIVAGYYINRVFSFFIHVGRPQKQLTLCLRNLNAVTTISPFSLSFSFLLWIRIMIEMTLL